MLKEKELSGYCVSDVRLIHTRLPVTIRANEPMSSIFKAGISGKRCRNIYVVTDNNTLLGVIRIKDMLRKLFPVTSLSGEVGAILGNLSALTADTAGKLMTTALCVTDSCPLNKVSSILIREGLLELPVVDESKRIIGEVDASEIIAFSLTRNEEEMAETK
ncbi:MAG: CBS domain-containing protein [Victivallaceae bacterium]|nr:CBS domain-containing protein [Victivallaceae bacterium]